MLILLYLLFNQFLYLKNNKFNNYNIFKPKLYYKKINNKNYLFFTKKANNLYIF